MGTHPVIEGLRQALASARSLNEFTWPLDARVRQLLADMVDGRVLPKAEANALRTSIIEFVRSEALPELLRRNPNEAVRMLDRFKAFGWTQLEGERPKLVAARASKFPPPEAATWPEIGQLHAAAKRFPDACRIVPGVDNVNFVKELQDDGLVIPDELIALYAACDGFDLLCREAEDYPVFSLLPSASIDISPEAEGHPRRAVVFQGGDDIQLSVYRDDREHWWLVHEYEYRPDGKKALELRELLRFGLQRMNASSEDALSDELSWDRFFGITDQ